MLQLIEEQLKNLLQKAGVTGEIEFTKPPKSEMGDFAFACFDLANEKGENPADVAKELVEKLKIEDLRLMSEVKAFGPYVNFYLRTCELANLVLDEVNKKDYGVNSIGAGKKVLIEYPSQNTHKEFHIGHLRNVCIGNTLVQLYRKSSYKVIPINYINDFGAHVVKCLWGIRKFHHDIDFDKIANKQKWLGQVYADANNESQDLEGAKEELDALQQKLESHDKEITKLFEQTREWSIAGFEKLHKELGVEHDHVFYESEVKEKGQKLVDKMLVEGIAEVGERGAIIINLEKFGLDIALLRKSTGAGLYMTSDLALAQEKFKKYKVDQSINVTGTEQEFYFKQLFKILQMSGFTHDMVHVGYGLVNLPEGKMSSRTGSVILYEDLRDEIFSHLEKETKDRHLDWSAKKVHDISFGLTMAVLKFTMQKHEAGKVVTFDMEEAVSFEGYSAPYILYVVARINSLLRKSKIKTNKIEIDYNLITEPEEKELLLQVAEYGKVVEKALVNYNPSVIAKYCFDLAKAFNDFYNKHGILNIDNKALVKARLGLSNAVRNVIVGALQLLTIETVDEM